MSSTLIFVLASIVGWLAVVVAARFARGPFFSYFAAVLLGVQTLSASLLWTTFDVIAPVYAFLHATVYVHFLSLVRPRLRPWWWRALITLPAHYFSAATFLAWPWAVVAGLGVPPYGVWAPYIVCLIGLWQSLRSHEEDIWIALEHASDDDSEIIEIQRGTTRVVGEQSEFEPGARPLRIAQIADPHVGPWMSPRRLRRVCERIVERNPDLVFFTGDLMTMESHEEIDALKYALEPLRAFQGRAFGCHGNHDYESPQVFLEALAHAGVHVLNDAEAVIQTESGPVQIVGFNWVAQGRREHLERVCQAHPRKADHLRIALLHDPGAFRHMPSGEADLTLSGHTHGGQLGLVSLGWNWTVVSALTSIPDHGLWRRGADHLYVHRGNGHYGFPLRLGVPAQEGLLHVTWQRRT